jgi:flavin-dependent dehydrogenase
VRDAAQAIPSRAVTSAWGGSQLEENHYLFSAIGGGWHLNRNLFDRMLAQQCEARGVHLLRNATAWGAQRDGRKWQLGTKAETYGAHFVVDATGRAAAFARMQGARLQFEDCLTSYTRFVTGSNIHVTETLIEAAPHGWWYTAPVPGGSRVVSYMTDADIGRDAGLPSTHAWMKLLNQTEHIRSSVGDGVAAQDCIVRAAATSHLDQVHGEGWLATGDASAAYDPLAAQGITKALRNGILASYAAADMLLGRAAEAVDRYTSILDNQFAAYRRAHRKHFAQQKRFPSSLFWLRRQVNSLVEGAA